MRCDSHVHVVGPAERYPAVQNRTYVAGLATLAEIELVAAARDVRRFVIVQPSFYRCLRAWMHSSAAGVASQ